MAPLHEITDQPFRRMIREVGGVGLTVSEMISSEALWRDHDKTREMLRRDETEGEYAIQLFGSSPDAMARAELPVNGVWPAAISYMIAPRLKRSERGSGSAPWPAWRWRRPP